ncbi:MAG TPA: phosphatase PAP2 family protein [Anaerolineales bacterium]|nr:phosphatase PAP2 family protein [Anaerolineales bacterium]
MDFLVQSGIEWITAIQSLGAWLEAPMRFFTFLGLEEFYFLILPLLYWCIHAELGLRVGFILIASTSLNSFFKLLFAAPRPYWVSERVVPFSHEESFGIPSGHAQNAVGVWGIMATFLRKRWAWMAAILLIFFIGFSRLYLGVHFVHDVLAGWLLGALILWAFLRLSDAVAAWFQSQSLARQTLVAFLISLIIVALGWIGSMGLKGYVFPQEWEVNALRAGPLPNPVSMEGFLTSGGSLFGLAFGAAWIRSRGGYQASGPVVKRALRYVIGLIGVLVLWMGLGQVFPDQADFLSFVLRYVRYALVGFWITGGAPWLFFRFKIANPSKI